MKTTSRVITSKEIIESLRQHRAELSQYHVSSLALFGSVARGDATPESDIDFLVEFSKPVGLMHLSRFQRFLEALFKKKIDLVVRDVLREEFRDQVTRELVRAA